MTVTERTPVHELSNAAIVEEARRYGEQLKAAGVAERAIPGEVARKYPGAIAIEAAAEQRREDILEKEEQREIVKMARVLGMRVYSTSQARAAKVTPGIPDLFLTHAARGFAGFFEAKRQVGGSRSTAQVEFGEACAAARVAYAFGDRYAFAAWLRTFGFTPPVPE